MLPVMRLRRMTACSLEPGPFSDLFGFLLNKKEILIIKIKIKMQT